MRKAAVGLGFVLCSMQMAHGQTTYAPPRTQEGKPEFSGVWSNAALTDLRRQPGIDKLIVTDEEAADLARLHPLAQLRTAEEGASDLNEDILKDRNTAIGYNAFWGEPGWQLGRVNGSYRTSWIVDPSNGQLPLSADGKKKAAALSDAEDTLFDGPDTFTPGNRCLVGLNGSGGPGMVNPMYNNNYLFVQTPNQMVIMVEMVHDARIIPISKSKAEAQAHHGPDVIKKWLGDPVGWWEGDTFVVETVNVHPRQGNGRPFYLSNSGKVTERFTRVAEDEIFYEFTVEDPTYYSQPWKAEMSFRPQTGSMFEYACHEGNYALPGMLRGARKVEAEGGTPKIDAVINPNWVR